MNVPLSQGFREGFCLVCVSELEALSSVGFFGCGQPMLGPKGAMGPPQNARVLENAVGLPVVAPLHF